MTSLCAENLSAMRGGLPVLRAASFVLDGGEFTGVLGPNGAGKSTLLRALAGLAPSVSGVARIAGRDIGTLAPRQRARLLSYLPQLREAHWNIEVERLAMLGRFAYGAPMRSGPEDVAAVERALADAGAQNLRSRRVHELSGGELARAHLARALAAEAPVLLADEPAAALDPLHQIAVMKALAARARKGAVVAAALHDINLAAHYCTRILIMTEGRIVADGAPDAVLSAARVREVFGVEASRIEIDGEAFLRLAAP